MIQHILKLKNAWILDEHVSIFLKNGYEINYLMGLVLVH